MKNYYEILEVKNFADQEVIKASYKALSKKYHPDLNPGLDEFLMKEINEAYDVLSNSSKKCTYDQQLKVFLCKVQNKEETSTIYNLNNENKDYNQKNSVSIMDVLVTCFRSVISIFVMLLLSFIGGWIMAMYLDVDGSWSYLFTYWIYSTVMGMIAHKISGNKSNFFGLIVTLIAVITLVAPYYFSIFNGLMEVNLNMSIFERFVCVSIEVIDFMLFSGWVRLLAVIIYVGGFFGGTIGELSD